MLADAARDSAAVMTADGWAGYGVADGLLVGLLLMTAGEEGAVFGWDLRDWLPGVWC